MTKLIKSRSLLNAEGQAGLLTVTHDWNLTVKSAPTKASLSTTVKPAPYALPWIETYVNTRFIFFYIKEKMAMSQFCWYLGIFSSGKCNCLMALVCNLQMNYIHLLVRDSKKCLWNIHFHSSIPEHRQRVLFLKSIQWQRTLQPLA